MMSARTGKLVLAASLALAPGLLLAQDRAVPRGGGDSGGGSRGGGSDAGSSHPGPSTSSSSGSSSSSSSSGSGGSSYSGGTSAAERRHPRAGTGTGSSGYYPGYPGYGGGYYPGYPVYGGGYYPGYGGYWWPYAYYGWYGGGYGGYGGFGYPGGTVYYSHSGGEGGSVRVLVDPAEARVYVDGYYAGVVDDFDGLFQRLHVSPGRHDISLKLEGYTTHRMRVYVGPDATVKLHYELQRGSGESFEDLSGGAPPPEREVRREHERDDDEMESAPGEPPAGEHLGQLRLRVEPADASVYVDGAFRGTGREAGALRLAPGRHRIEVVRPGYRTADQEIEVAPGETTQLSVTLERPSI